MKLLVSSDIVGFLGNPLNTSKAYQSSRSILGNQLHLELIGWRHLNLARLLSYPSSDIKISGIHGRMGSDDTLLISLLDFFLTPTPLLTNSHAPSQIDYILFHQQEAEKHLSTFQHPSPFIMVENHTSKGSLQKTSSLVSQIQSLGTPSGVMIDLVHLLKELGLDWQTGLSGLDTCWSKMLDTLSSMIPHLSTFGFHLPIGNDSDSLPLFHITDNQLSALSNIIKQNSAKISHLVLENHFSERQIYLSSSRYPSVDHRNHRIITRLNDLSLI